VCENSHQIDPDLISAIPWLCGRLRDLLHIQENLLNRLFGFSYLVIHILGAGAPRPGYLIKFGSELLSAGADGVCSYSM
jgi:hypothetical protein